MPPTTATSARQARGGGTAQTSAAVLLRAWCRRLEGVGRVDVVPAYASRSRTRWWRH